MKSNLAKIIGNVAFVALLFLFSGQMQAQTGWHPIIGVKGGLNVDNFNAPILGSNIGAYFAMEKADVWGVGLEAFYAQRHWQTLNNDQPRLVTYLEVPLYVNYFFLRKYTTIRPKIVLGPSFNFLLEDSDKPKNVQNAEAANFEFAGIFGLGFNKDLTKDGHITMFFDARYMHGFTSITEKENGVSVDINRTLRFHAGVGFSLTGGRKKK